MTLPKKETPVPGGESTQTKSAGKKPYQKPAFVRERLFETMALACGKTNPVIAQCRTVRRNS